jgi:hypothetical protein
LLLAQPELLTPPFPTLPSLDALLPLARRQLLFSLLCYARVCSGSGRGRVGPRSVHGPYLQGTSKTSKHADVPRTSRTGGGGSPLTNEPTGSMVNAQRDASSFRPALRSMARRARVAAYSRGKRLGINRDYASTTGSASSCISKMWSGLSIRGTIRW